MNTYIKRIIERVRNEPVMVATALAVLATFVFDLGPEERTQIEVVVQTIILVVLGGAARRKVSPVRKLKNEDK